MKRETGPESGLAFGCGEAGRHSRAETGASGGVSRTDPDAAAKAVRLCGRGAACGWGMRKRLRSVVTESGCTAGIRRRTVPGSSCAELFSAEERERQRGGGEQRSGSHDARPAEVRPCGAREECTQRAAREIGAHEDRIDAVRGRRA